MQKICGLWKRKSKAGKDYLSGSFPKDSELLKAIPTKDVSIMIFKNEFKKEGDRGPDYQVFVAERSDPRQVVGPLKPVANPIKNTEEFDDIPF